LRQEFEARAPVNLVIKYEEIIDMSFLEGMRASF
jgi:hypothetical protein